MKRVTAMTLMRNAARAGNRGGAAACARATAKPTIAGGAVAALDTLEARFDRRWADLGGPALAREHRFDARRRWRFDRAHVGSRVAVEVDGGIWTTGGGRHNRAAGYIADCEKLNQAAAQGWTVFRVTPAHLDDGHTLVLILRTIREREA